MGMEPLANRIAPPPAPSIASAPFCFQSFQVKKKFPSSYTYTFNLELKKQQLNIIRVSTGGTGTGTGTISGSSFGFPLASRIIVKNLPYCVGESALLKEFSSFGHIAQINLVKDDNTKISKGYAFIQYSCQDEALLALEYMDRKKFEGRLIYVELAQPGRHDFQGAPRTCGPPDLARE